MRKSTGRKGKPRSKCGYRSIKGKGGVVRSGGEVKEEVMGEAGPECFR